MFATCLRLLSRRTEETARPTKIIENLLKQHGPQTANDCWKLAQPVGIKSKTHMKSLLRWLIEKERVRVICNHLKQAGGQQKGGQRKGGQQKGGAHGAKEFLYTIPKKPCKKSDASVAEPELLESSTEVPELFTD